MIPKAQVMASTDRSSSSSVSEKQPDLDFEKLSKVIQGAKENLLSKKIKDQYGEYWAMPGYLGMHYVSQFFLFTKWFNIKVSRLDQEHLLSLILSRQNKPEGFWLALEDKNLKSPNALDPSIYHYWALKILRNEFPHRQVEIDEALAKAKNYILARGGADEAILFTKVVMALFGNYSWDKIPYIPSLTFNPLVSPFVVNEFSQWVIPHLRPLGYIRAHRIVKNNLGEEFSIKELFNSQSKNVKFKAPNLLDTGLQWLEQASQKNQFNLEMMNQENWQQLVENEIVPGQKPRGSWGGYTLSTIFSIIVLDHYYDPNHVDRQKINSRINKGFEFLSNLYLNTGSSSYQGVLDDGSYWDTALALRALRENGTKADVVQGPAQFLANLQQKDGSFPFGYDFEDYSDVDDTVETVFALEGLNLSNYNKKKAIGFVERFQNSDFGWGTFTQNNNGNALLKFFTKDFNDSAEIFDISRPDVTGHALELLAQAGHTVQNSFRVEKAIEYLRSARDKKTQSSWLGRWAVNHIFGTSAVVTGLVSVGMPTSDPLIQDSLKWLMSIQNSDGGFGETTESYNSVNLLIPNKSVSTASQTAWAIMALTDGGNATSEVTTKAVEFLIQQFQNNGIVNSASGFWTDPSVTGTGHPGLIYMVYPSYPYTWPLIALGKYMRVICKSEIHSEKEYCQNYKGSH
jgi:squalene-hopene/tetraprenyl-beta-curcumene cyclase